MRSRTPRRRLREALAGGPGAPTGSRCKSRALQALRAGGAHEVSSGTGGSPPGGMGSTATISPRPQAGQRRRDPRSFPYLDGAAVFLENVGSCHGAGLILDEAHRAGTRRLPRSSTRVSFGHRVAPPPD